VTPDGELIRMALTGIGATGSAESPIRALESRAAPVVPFRRCVMLASRRIPLRFPIAVSAAALALALAGCASSGGASDDPPEPSETTKPLTANALVGTWGSTDEQKPNLVFDDEGGLTGTDGCNRLVGSWSVEGNAVVFSDVVGTLMACEGVDTWLRDAASAQFVAGDDDELQVFDSTNTEIGILERAG
jgi:heat shock protein HslJ